MRPQFPNGKRSVKPSVMRTAKKRLDPRTGLAVRLHNGDPFEPKLTIDDRPELTLAILRGARTETICQTMGSRAVRRSPRLAWEELIQLYGDEATLGKRVENARASAPSGAELLELAGKYLSGWRPGRDDD